MVLKASYVGRFGRRLLAQADANQVLDFPDPVSGQLFSQAFATSRTRSGKDANPADLTAQPWFENVVSPGLGQSQGYAEQYGIPALQTTAAWFYIGDFGDFTQAISMHYLRRT